MPLLFFGEAFTAVVVAAAARGFFGGRPRRFTGVPRAATE